MDQQLSIVELIDLVNQTLTINCKIPQFLPNEAIHRIIYQDALRYFYKKYKYALQRTYYYVDMLSLYKMRSTDVKFITLPDEIEAITWIYMVGYNDMFNLGYLLPQNSISFGQTSQPYVASINVSEWAESMAVMQNFQDALATFNKNTVKFSFNPNSKRFEVQTSLKHNLVLSVYAHIPEENLYGDHLFIKYVTGRSLVELAVILSIIDTPLAGNAKINVTSLQSRGEALILEVQEAINKITNVGWFLNSTR